MITLQSLAAVTLLGLLSLAVGCKSGTGAQPAPATSTPAATQSAVHYPPRPAVPPPPFHVFHQDADSVTLVTRDDATDAQIESLIWELHDAARNHSFDQLKIPQKLVDARNPILWFHIYRGAKCASEKYTTGTLPCGASYHAAGDYTLGSFSSPKADSGLLLQGENHSTLLWNPAAT